MSTELAAAMLLDDIRKNVDKGQLVGAVFVDLSKAFDTISHSKLVTKLPSYGIGGKELTSPVAGGGASPPERRIYETQSI